MSGLTWSPEEITEMEGLGIITNRKPLGMFYWQEGNHWIGCDNTTGNAWTEEFITKEDCLEWLEGDGYG